MIQVLPLRARAVVPVMTATLQVQGVFSAGTNTNDPLHYYDTGTANPAVSAAAYYGMNGLHHFKPYDLLAMGSQGAAIAAARGRYVWPVAADHPTGNQQNWMDGAGFKIGFSSDPGILPDELIEIIPMGNQFSGSGLVGTVSTASYTSDFVIWLLYNPDDVSGKVFRLYCQTFSNTITDDARGTQGGCWRSADLFVWEPVGLSHGCMKDLPANDLISSFQQVFRRGPNDFISIGAGGYITRMGTVLWTSTDGNSFTYTSHVYNTAGFPATTVTFNQTGATPLKVTTSTDVFSPSEVGNTWGLSVYYDTSSVIQGYTNTITSYVGPREVNISWDVDAIVNAARFLEIGQLCNRYATAASGALSAFSRNATNVCEPFIINGQTHLLMVEDARHSGQSGDEGMVIAAAPVDGNYSVISSPNYTRISGIYSGTYAGPGYVQGVGGLPEDGILHIYAALGFFCQTVGLPNPAAPYLSGMAVGSVATTTLTISSMTSGYAFVGAYIYTGPSLIGQITKQLTGTANGVGTYAVTNPGSISAGAGSTININGGGGGLNEQFIDYYTYDFNPAASASAAPFGVRAACTNDVVTISWLECKASPQTYRVKRYTSLANANADASPTTVNTVVSLSVLDTPTTGSQYWYRVVKLNGGIEGSYRIVTTYVG